MTASDILGFVPNLIGSIFRYFVDRPDVTLEPLHRGSCREDFAAETGDEYTDIYLTVQVANNGGETAIRKATLESTDKKRHVKDTKFLTGIVLPRRSVQILKIRFTCGGHVGGVDIKCKLSLVDTGNRGHDCKLEITCKEPPYNSNEYIY